MATTTPEKRADKWFSRLVRLSNMADDMHMQCCTCLKRKHIKEIDAGHFVPRGVWETRFDDVNVQPQCSSCNRGMFPGTASGSPLNFVLFVMNVYGDEELIRLLRIYNKRNVANVKTPDHVLDSIATESRKECHAICKQKGIKLSDIWAW